MTLLLDMVNFLKDASIVVGDGTDAFRDFIPEQPDSVVCLQEYAGDPAILYDTSVHRSVQIVCRDMYADIARQKALTIFTKLRDSQSPIGVVKFSDTRWGQVHMRQAPFKLKVDENNRTYYAFNIGITTTVE